MYEPASALTPLAIDRVERARGQGDRVRLRLSGRWLTTRSGGVASSDVSDLDALLVVQMHGRRHRFPATRERRDEPGADGAGTWVATFTVPDWAVPEQAGQASLWVGSAVVPVPPPGTPAESVEPSSVPDPSSPGAGDPPPPPPPPLAEHEALGGEHGRSGPLADLLFKETVSALHSELEQRSTEAARLRGALAEARSDVGTRSSAQAGLEAAHGELRHELQRLMAAVTQQRADFDEQLAAIGAERDGARTERDGALAERDGALAELEAVRAKAESVGAELELARAEAESVGAELASARAELESVGAELASARAELESVGADAESARAEVDRRAAEVRVEAEALLAAVRGEAETQRAAARGEAEAQLAAARREAGAQLAAARGETEAQVAAARAEAEQRLGEVAGARDERAAHAAALSDRISSLIASERRWAQEAAAAREQLAGAHISRDAALSEAAGLRGELDRLGSELAVSRERSGAGGGELSEAQQLLADARSLTEQLRDRSGS